MTVWFIVVHMLTLHTLDGREIDVNPVEITHMREAKSDDQDDKDFVKGVRCMVNLSDGKYVTVVETCENIRKLMESDK